ncbi:MAG: GAF domain-containing protein [Desulfobulbaceae bacterium]|nr:MAG: GAF domain-containing protein [Desulfobulbaceae bacterium]
MASVLKSIVQRTVAGHFPRISALHASSVFYRLTLAFSLLFLTALSGFVFLGMTSNLLGSRELQYCLLGMLVISLGSYAILKEIARGILNIEARLTGRNSAEPVLSCLSTGESELSSIARLTEEMATNLEQVRAALSCRNMELQGIRELSRSDVVFADPREFLNLAMEKAMLATSAVGGVVLLIPGGEGESADETCVRSMGRSFLVDAVGLQGVSEYARDICAHLPQGILLEQRDPLFQRFFTRDCKAVAMVPFSLGKGQEAVVVLAAGAGQSWDGAILSFLSALFQTTSRSFKMSELWEREQETSRELYAVLNMLRIITTAQEAGVFSAIASALFDLFPAQWLGLAYFDPLAGELRLAQNVHRNTGSRLDETVVLERSSSLFQRAIDLMGRLDCHDLEHEPNCSERMIFSGLGLRSCMIHSLDLNGRIIGSICLGYETVDAFGTRDKKYFSMFASGISIALEQGRLLAREKRRSSELEILNRVGVALTSSAFDIKRVLHQIVEMVVQVLGTEMGAVMLLDQDVLNIQAVTGCAGKNLEGMQIQLGEGLCGWVATTGDAVINHDAVASSHGLSEFDERAGIITRNVLCIPMISNGRVIGVFLLANKQGRFTDDDYRTLKAVAASTAIALENNRLYFEMARLVEKERLIRTIFQKYVPKEIVNNILEKDEHEQMTIGERKMITVFNIDIRGYSEMSKISATEEVVEVLNYFYMKMGSIILRNKGMVDKYLGDGFLAIFGAPVATKNPALDAVFAAIEMTQTIKEVSRKAVERFGIPLRIGISLNTGEAIVGNIGFDRKMEYTAIGDVVNETFRLQELTREKSDLILIGESTYQRVKPYVLVKPWGKRAIDNSGGEMMVYEVIARREFASPILTNPAKEAEIQQVH